MASDIFAKFEQTANLYPDNLALEMLSDDGDIRYTYREALNLIKLLGQSLRNREVRKGEKVAFWARLSPNWAIAYFGALQSGSVNVPLDIEYEAKDLSPILSEIDCRFIFTMQEKVPALKKALQDIKNPPVIVLLDAEGDGDGLISVNSLFEEDLTGPPPPEISPEDIATIFFTSGTTGKPKGVIISHHNMISSVTGLLQYIEVSERDKVLAVIPSHHIFASLANLLVPLARGGSTTFLRTINSVELMRTMQTAGITVFPAVPQVYYLLHKKIFEEVESKPPTVRLIFRSLLRLSNLMRRTTGINPGPVLFSRVHKVFGGRLRLLVSAASYFDPKIIRDFYSLGFTVQQGYALTETFGGGAFTPYFDNVIGSVGRPFPGVKIKIVDPDETGVGEIAISGDTVMQGYLNDPVKTAEVLREGWFYTGDLGSIDEKGNLFIRGRRKEMIVLSSGKKIYPEEVEEHYLQIPHIRELCVLGVSGVDDYANSERLHAVIVPDFDYLKQHRIVNSREIIREEIEARSASLPKYKRILTYELQTEPLPRTASRKIMRFKVVPNLNNGASKDNKPMVTPYRSQEGDDLLQATETSRQALEVIRRETSVDCELHLDMNLELDLGFDSLQRIELLAQIEQVTGVRLGDDIASQAFTVRDLLKSIVDLQRKGGSVQGQGSSQAPARITWKEIIASADTDDMAGRYIISPSTFSRTFHYLGLRFINLIARIFFKLKVHGIENLPQDRPFLICPNHQGYLDGPLVSSVMPWRVLKYMFTLGFTPFFSGGFKEFVARVGRIVPIDADTNLGRAMKISAIGLKAKQNLLLFPEGGLTCDGELQKFKKGVGILASELNVPIVPVAINGSFEAWSKVGDGVRFTPISITFGKPLYPGEGASLQEDPEMEYSRIALQIRSAVSELLNGAKANINPTI